MQFPVTIPESAIGPVSWSTVLYYVSRKLSSPHPEHVTTASVMLTNTVVKNSFPLFVMTLLVTSQLSGIKSVEASEERACCPCGQGNVPGWFRDLAAMMVTESKLQKFASKSGGLGGIMPSTRQKTGTASGSPRKQAAEMAGKAYNYAPDKRCCPCRSKRDFRGRPPTA